MQKSKDEVLDLVAQAKAGDAEAFGVIYSNFLNPIFRFIRAQIRDQVEVEDLTQEVFVKAFSRLDQFGKNGDHFSAWLYQIARTTVLDWYKKKKMIIVDEPDEVFGRLESPHGNPLVLALNKEKKELIDEALAGLGHTDREVVVLHYVNDLSHTEIAKILGLSEDAVRQRKSRALRSLRAILGK